ncbi:hypothetical protein ACP4OV_024196 [Aristida adscensionis]
MPPGEHGQEATPEAADGEGVEPPLPAGVLAHSTAHRPTAPATCSSSLGARRPFDGMPPAKRVRGDKAAVACDGGGLDALPDAVLERVLGFLPAEDAVRTCVLASRWRHLWKSAKGLRVVAADGGFLGNKGRLLDFVGHLLILRERAPLDKCELELDTHCDLHFMGCVSAWFRHAVACKVRFLRLGIHCRLLTCAQAEWHQLHDQTLVSQHLTRLELYGAGCGTSFLDFSSCPALEHLVFDCCDLSAEMISCKSLKYLRITNSSFNQDSRIHICTPNLVYLRLKKFSGKTPILQSMPSLVEAFVEITKFCHDQCQALPPHFDNCGCEECQSSSDIGHGNYTSVILKGVSEAKNLTLISLPRMFIFRMDLRCCPTFSKLKTLVLKGYWCVDDDFYKLLEHSPVLEKLTLLFSEGPKYKVEMEGSINETEKSAAISEHLRTVEIKCEEIDHWVLKVIWFLRISNIFVSGSRSDLPSHYINTSLQIVAFDLRPEEIQAAVDHCLSPSRNGRLKLVLTMLPSFVHG